MEGENMERNGKKMKIDKSELDGAIEKASRLKELLQEAATLINSLSLGEKEMNVNLVLSESANGNTNNLIKENNNFPNVVCGV
jgi:hypothetical protein